MRMLKEGDVIEIDMRRLFMDAPRWVSVTFIRHVAGNNWADSGDMLVKNAAGEIFLWGRHFWKQLPPEKS